MAGIEGCLKVAMVAFSTSMCSEAGPRGRPLSIILPRVLSLLCVVCCPVWLQADGAIILQYRAAVVKAALTWWECALANMEPNA